jgi:hypothetical protein
MHGAKLVPELSDADHRMALVRVLEVVASEPGQRGSSDCELIPRYFRRH